MDLGRTCNNDDFALGAFGVSKELFIRYGCRHMGRVEYERSGYESLQQHHLFMYRPDCWAREYLGEQRGENSIIDTIENEVTMAPGKPS